MAEGGGLQALQRALSDAELVSAAARSDAPVFKPGCVEVLMLAARRSGLQAVGGVLYRQDGTVVSSDDAVALPDILEGYSRVDEEMRAAAALQAKARELAAKRARNAQDALRRAHRAVRDADDTLLIFAFVAWDDEATATGSRLDRERADALRLQLRTRNAERRSAARHGADVANSGKPAKYSARNARLLKLFHSMTGNGQRDYSRAESTEAYKAVAKEANVDVKRAREIIAEARRAERNAASR